MRQTDVLVLLGAIAHSSPSLVAASSSGLPRGVAPEFALFYPPLSPAFSCIYDPSIALSLSQINDHSCDCPDGSDEPGTSACAHLDSRSPPQPLQGSPTGTTNNSALALPGFWCANDGHVPAYIPFLYVDDGVCDYRLCCDGSDEDRTAAAARLAGRRDNAEGCENRCGPIGEEFRRAEAGRLKSHENALKRRSTLAKEARELRRQATAKAEKLRGEIAELEMKKEDLQKELEEAELEAKSRVVHSGGDGPASGGGKLGVLRGLAKSRIKELRETLGKVLEQRDHMRDRVTELEGILTRFKEEYNPNFNDEGVKTAVKAWEDYAAKTMEKKEEGPDDQDVLEVLKEDDASSGINWDEFQDEALSDADVVYNIEAYLPPFLRAYVHAKITSMRAWLVENGVLAYTSTGGSGGSGANPPLVRAARERFQAVADDLSSKGASLGELERDLDGDFGPGDIFRALKGSCISSDSGEYTYELCWMENAQQKSRKGGGGTGMGTFARIDREQADEEERADLKSLGRGERMVLRYEDGQHCWSGPNRRTDVWLACAEADEIWRVSEAEKCVYRMEVGTPAACEVPGVGVEPAKEGGKDEL